MQKDISRFIAKHMIMQSDNFQEDYIFTFPDQAKFVILQRQNCQSALEVKNYFYAV